MVEKFQNIKVAAYNVIMIHPTSNLSLLPQNGITIIYKWIIPWIILSPIWLAVPKHPARLNSTVELGLELTVSCKEDGQKQSARTWFFREVEWWSQTDRLKQSRDVMRNQTGSDWIVLIGLNRFDTRMHKKALHSFNCLVSSLPAYYENESIIINNELQFILQRNVRPIYMYLNRSIKLYQEK